MPLVWQTQFRHPDLTTDVLYELCKDWLRRPGMNLPIPESLEEGEWRNSTADAEVAIQKIEDAAGKRVAIRLNRTVNNQGITWLTDIGATERADHLHLSMRLRQEPIIGALPKFDSVEVSAPGILYDLLRKHPIPDLSSEVLEITTVEEAERFLDSADSPTRFGLIVLISVDNWTRAPLVDPTRLLRRVFGIASVVVVSKEISLALPGLIEQRGAAQSMGRLWGAYNGAIRLYRPSCDFSDGSPFDHPLHLAPSVRRPDFLDDLQDWALTLSTLLPEAPTVDVPQLRREKMQAQLTGVKDIRTYEEIIKLTEEERDQAKQERDIALISARKAEKEAARLRWQHDETQQRSKADSEGDDNLDIRSDAPPALNYYRSEGGKRPVLDFIDDLPVAEAAIARSAITQLPNLFIEGLSRHIEKVKGGAPNSARAHLYEFRVNTQAHWLRFFFAQSKSVSELLLLTGYPKKQNELDPDEIARAAKCLDNAWNQGWK